MLALVLLLVWRFESRKTSSAPVKLPAETNPLTPPSVTGSSSDGATAIYAHNVLLRKSPEMQVYVSWLRGRLWRTNPNVVPSFDEPESFFIDIDTGVLHVDLKEVAGFLNADFAKSHLRNISLSGEGSQLKLTGTLHKVLPLPIQMTSTMSPLPDGRIQMHVTKIEVVKIPVGGLLRDFHLEIADLFDPKSVPGVQVSGNNIYLDATALTPAPHIRGHFSSIQIVNSNLEEVYGNSMSDEARVEQWRNFLRLRDGTINFGRLTMHPVDIIMIDTSSDQWFDIDMARYSEQIVNGYTRMTPEAGLQIFMPGLNLIPRNKANENISIEWMKNRNIPPPADISSKQ